MASKKKVPGIPELKLPAMAELRKMSMTLLKVPTMNWEETDLGIEELSDEEEIEEQELTGIWRTESPWGDPEWEFVGVWDYGDEGNDLPEDEDGEEEEEEGEEDQVGSGSKVVENVRYEEEEGEVDDDGEEEEEFAPRQKNDKYKLAKNLVVVRKGESCEGGLESFTGISSKESKKNKGGRKTTIQLPPIKASRDLKPMPGTICPRYIWETESETTLGKENRQVQVMTFEDNSIIEPVFRIWRRTAQRGEAELELAEEDVEDIEDLLSLEVLEAIRSGFSKGPLTMEKYKAVVIKALKIPPHAPFPEVLGQLFIKIDTFGIGKISWDDLCDFMQQKYAEKAETEYTSPLVDLVLPCKPFETPHRGPISRALTLPDHGLLTFSEDGIVSLWTPKFQPRIWRALGRPAGLKSMNTTIDKRTNKWFTDIVLLQGIGKYVVVTGQRELQFYDTSTFDPYCQINSLYSVPVHLDAKSQGNGLVIAMGDMTGCLSIFIIDDALSTLRSFSQARRIHNVPTLRAEDTVLLPGVRYVKYQVHTDMISNVMYVPSMNRVITSSMDVHKSLVMGKLLPYRNATELMEDLSSGKVYGITDLKEKPKLRRPADQVQFPITKGCRCFDVWEEKKWVVAGGLDRLVWVWNLYTESVPIAKLRGHNAAIHSVVFDTKSETVFSICTEKTIRIWTLFTNTCIHVFDMKMTGLRGPIIYCFCPTTDAVFIQTSVEAAYIKMKRRGYDALGEDQTHKDSICALMYNSQHELFLSCSSEDIFVWECASGRLVQEFNTIGGDGSMHLDTIAMKLEKTMEEDYRFIMPVESSHGREVVDTYDVGPVTAVALDNFGRRFFTTHTNGVLKAWNFYNGRNLYNLYKPNANLDICDMHYITINDEHRYLVTVGWDRKVIIYIDREGPEVLKTVTVPEKPIEFSNKDYNHRDDVWAVAFGFPNMIASGDYSGKLLVWNINSGHVVAKLIANQCRDHCAMKDSFITSLLFYEKKTKDSKNTYLISAGPYHLIHIWRANTTRELNVGSVGWTRPCEEPEDFVTCIRYSKHNNHIITSDTWGCVSIWEIFDALGKAEPTNWFSGHKTSTGRNKLFEMQIPGAPVLSKRDQGYGKGPVQFKLVRSWKAHVDGFAALEVCETYGLVVTGGKDCSVRVWDMFGRHMGILGSGHYWTAGDPESYAVSSPRDVILDIKRIRAMEVFRQKAPPPLEIEEIAESRARLLIEQKKKELLTDEEIQERSLMYESLIDLDQGTMVWLKEDAPVGPHHGKPLASHSLLKLTYGGQARIKRKYSLDV